MNKINNLEVFRVGKYKMKYLIIASVFLSACGPSKEQVAFMDNCQSNKNEYYQCAYLWAEMHKENCGAGAARAAGTSAIVGGMIGSSMGGSGRR